MRLSFLIGQEPGQNNKKKCDMQGTHGYASLKGHFRILKAWDFRQKTWNWPKAEQ